METLITIIVKSIIFFTLLLIASFILELMMTGSSDLDVGFMVNGLLDLVFGLPEVLLQAALLLVTGILDIAIGLIWSIIPGIGDLVTQPSVSDLI
jgi:hypothetical protein